MRSSIRNVAEEAGVSIATVSMVLRGIEGRTTDETRERVLKVARRLSYTPVKPPTSQNRPLETGIVTLVPEHQEMEKHDLHMLTYQGVVSVARRYGYDVLTSVGQESQQYTDQERTRYLDRRSDGFIFAVSYQGPWEDALQLLPEYKIPAVACFRPEAPAGVAAVSVDNAGAIRIAVEHLIAHGHRRIAYLCGPPDNFDEEVRRRAWVQVMREHGLEASERLLVPGSGPRHALDAATMASVAQLGVTAVACYNDAEALALWKTLEAQGLKVPDDISLVGIDDNPSAAPRNLTTIAHSFMDIGRLAMEAWIELRNGGEARDCYKLAPVKLIARASVRDLSA
ncbi:HTH-type transcriptional repressor CytR [Abditibacteriota bacterium]|nr:HTH-type transcriptional repressor CytR [Abditibacteriota bacterium]